MIGRRALVQSLAVSAAVLGCRRRRPRVLAGFSQMANVGAWRIAETNSMRQATAERPGFELIVTDAQDSTAKQIGDVAEYVLSLSKRGTDAAAAKRGEAIFAENCVACHQEGGTGNKELGAPNLAANIWIYGGDKATIMETIRNSRQGSMPAWAERLDDATIKMLAVYVHGLGGGK